MNESVQQYWNEFWKGKEPPKLSVTAEQFGYDAIADELAQLIIDGKKTATCSAYALYEIGNEPLPATDKYTIVLNNQNQPVGIIKITDVIIIRMNEVSNELALAEGGLTFEYWWDEHKLAFTEDLAGVGLEFSEDMLLVFERFEVIDVKK